MSKFIIFITLGIILSDMANVQVKLNVDREKTIYDEFKLKVNLLVMSS
jgi:hypothetical protein